MANKSAKKPQVTCPHCGRRVTHPIVVHTTGGVKLYCDECCRFIKTI